MHKSTAERVQENLLSTSRSHRENRTIHHLRIRWDYHWIRNGVVDHIDDHFSYLLPLRKRTEALLSDLGIFRLRSLLQCSEMELKQTPGFGPSRIREINVLLRKHGVTLGTPSRILRSLFGPPRKGRVDQPILSKTRSFVCSRCDSSGWIWCPMCRGYRSRTTPCDGCHGHLINTCPNTSTHHHRKDGS